MADEVIDVEIDTEPSDLDSDYGPGRSFEPEKRNPAERDAKFDRYSQVYLKCHIAVGTGAYLLTVVARKKIVKELKNKKKTFVFWEYQLEDSTNQPYENGAWVPEKELESCNGT